jgi:hypothetical protein
MCEWGTTEKVRVRVPADLSATGTERWKEADVDSCIAPLVAALQGVGTLASCCGHGHRPGNVALADGRELLVFASFADARAADLLFPDIHGEAVLRTAEATP